MTFSIGLQYIQIVISARTLYEEMRRTDLEAGCIFVKIEKTMQRTVFQMSFSFLLILFCFQVHAQQPLTTKTVYDTISTLPQHFEDRYSKFLQEPIIKGRIVFLGNSITEGANWGSLIGDTTAINRGIGGDLTYSVLKRLDDVIIRQPSKVFLMIGINDIGKDVPDTVIAENIRTIIKRIQAGSPSTRIYLENVLPVNAAVQGFPQHYDKNPHVLATNRMLVKVARDAKVQLIDMHQFFTDREGYLEKNYTKDGLHINAKGYQVWVEYLKKEGWL
jgi:lysophospholipase L1-like esterase